ncbi:hypothetical protein [Microcystis phage Mae-Yong1326-1]|nr:hypothetical protein [Microcystis phage Mae-Yong1326-1]
MVLTPEKIARLEAAAKAAPPGKWWLDTSAGSCNDLRAANMMGYTRVQFSDGRTAMLPHDTARFVAEADPETVLALIAVVMQFTGGWWPMAPHIAAAPSQEPHQP